MRTLYLAFVRRIAKWKLLSFRVDEEKRDFSVAADCRTGRIFHYLRHLEDIFRPGRGFSAVKSCLPGARQEGFYPIPVVKIPPMKWWNPPVKGPKRFTSKVLTKTCLFSAPSQAALGGLSHVRKPVNPPKNVACSFSPIFCESYLTNKTILRRNWPWYVQVCSKKMKSNTSIIRRYYTTNIFCGN